MDNSKRPLTEFGPMQRRREQEAQSRLEDPHALVRPVAGRSKPPRRRRRGAPLLAMLLGAALMSAVLLALPFAIDLAYAGRVLPGLSLQGQPLGGLDASAVQQLVDQRYSSLANRSVTLTFQEQSWSPTLNDLGVRFESAPSVATAMSFGRRGDPLTRSHELLALWRGVDLGPRLIVDQAVMQRYLLSLAEQLERSPRDAALSIAEARVIATAARSGVQLLVDQTAADLQAQLTRQQFDTLALRTRTIDPSISDAASALAAEQARLLLRGPLTLRQGERSWTWEPERLAELLWVRGEQGRLIVEPEPSRLAEAVQRLAQLVDSQSAEPRVEWNAGNLTIIEPGQRGVQLLQEQTSAAISAALSSETRTIELPVQELSPQVTAETLPGLGINSLLGEGKSSFAGSAAYRITNIIAGAQRFHGVLIPPGAEFSFNTQLGEVNAENGFVEGYAIIGNRTQLEWGGGVCQDSTTVFRAAFWAGLPITERHAHAFYISWYDRFAYGAAGDGQGMDATIYTGVQDLKFLNDTEGWILLQAVVDQTSQVLTVQIYGRPTGRTVAIDGPHISAEIPAPSEPVYIDDPSLPRGQIRQTDVARNGRDIAIYRIISDNGVPRAPELFFTRFRAWPNVFVRGSG